MKAMSVSFRIDVEDLNILQALSMIDERLVGDLIREAIKKYVKSRHRDPNVKKQIKATRKRQEDLYKALLTPRKGK